MDWDSEEVVVLDRLSGGSADGILFPYRCTKGSGQLCISIAISVSLGTCCLWRRRLSLFTLICLCPFAPLLDELGFRGLAAFSRSV